MFSCFKYCSFSSVTLLIPAYVAYYLFNITFFFFFFGYIVHSYACCIQLFISHYFAVISVFLFQPTWIYFTLHQESIKTIYIFNKLKVYVRSTLLILLQFSLVCCSTFVTVLLLWTLPIQVQLSWAHSQIYLCTKYK